MTKRNLFVFVCGLAVLLGLWWLGARLINDRLVLPTPKAVFVVLVGDPIYYFKISLRTLLFAAGGLGVSATLAFIAGFAITGWRGFEFIYPIMVAIKATPAVIFAPILSAIIGSGIVVKVSVAALIALFPILVQTIEGARLTPEDLKLLGAAYGASRWRMIWKIESVYLVNGWLTGIQSAAPLAIIGAIVAEFVDPSDALKGGIGVDIATKSRTVFIPHLYAGAICAVMVGMLSFGIAHWVSRSFQRRFELGD